ncbi:hypothetical protein NPIL_140531 [Nephila pilipes]|uniref:Uncharacterized protein n=1 Tax=Nephila pilipes TaxID=299642 RepID=A0A8X6T7Z1_NEPPI|nr:hypothetical protein NPIL_140531 [Nephila pilipes]
MGQLRALTQHLIDIIKGQKCIIGKPRKIAFNNRAPEPRLPYNHRKVSETPLIYAWTSRNASCRQVTFRIPSGPFPETTVLFGQAGVAPLWMDPQGRSGRPVLCPFLLPEMFQLTGTLQHPSLGRTA